MLIRPALLSLLALGIASATASASQVQHKPSRHAAAAPSITPPQETHEAPKGVRLQKGGDSVLVEWGATADTIKADFPKTICSSMGSGKSFCAPDLLEGWCVGFGSAYPDTQFFQLYNDHFYKYTVEYDVSSHDEIASAFTTVMGKPGGSQREQVQNGFGAKWDAITTVWKIGDVMVTVADRAEKMDRGRITITNGALAPPKKPAEKAPF